MSGSIEAIPILIAMACLFHLLPGWTRPDLFFAVTVDQAFRNTPEARRILARFRIVVWASTLAAIGLTLLAMPLAAVPVAGFGFIFALVDAHRRTLPFAAAPNPVREVDVAASPERLPGWPVVEILPLLFLAALGIWAHYHWDELPARLAVHQGFHGVDRWAARTPEAVYGLLATFASTCLLMVGTAWALLHWSRRIATTGPGAAGERQFRRRVVQLLIVSEYFLAVPALVILFQPNGPVAFLWPILFVALMVIFTISLIRSHQGGSRAMTGMPGPPTGDRTPDSCWKWGLLYINPTDPSILVEKRFGIGYTLNLGNRWSWVVLLVVLVPAALALIFLR